MTQAQTTDAAGYYIVRFVDSGYALGRYHVGESRRAVPPAFASTFDTEAQAVAALAAYGQADGVVTQVTAGGRRDVSRARVLPWRPAAR